MSNKKGAFKKQTNKVISNYLYLLLIQGTNFLLPLITFPYLVRVLNLENYGIVMMAGSLMVFLNIFVDFGFNISATRHVSLIRNDKHALSNYFWNIFLIKFFLLVLSFLILLFLTLFFDKFREYALIYLFSFGVVIGQSLFPTWLFQGIERMRVITIVNVLAKIIFTVTIFIFIKSSNDYLLVPVLNSLGFVIAGIIGFLISLKYVLFKKPKRVAIVSIIKENSHLVVSNFATSIYTSGNTFILGIVAGKEMAGIYSSMEKLVMATKTIYIPLYQAIFPWLATKSKNEVIIFIHKIKKYIIFSSLFIVSIIFIFAEQLLAIIYDNPIIVDYANVFRLLGFIAFFASLNMMYVSLLFPALKMYKYRMIPLLSAGIVDLILALILGYYFSIFGVAFTAVFSEFLILVISFYYFKTKIIK
ncbi:MAG TPA: hypothetical protein ENK67_01115 [Flavobacteriia bacterium]|nr:hypothetical protein [Flavobacteriia bacterium]